MADIVPFKAVRPKRSKVHLVSSRPYYTYEKSHLKAKLETNPYSFLHVINPEFKKNHGTKPNSIERFNLVKDQYEKFKTNNLFIQDEKSSFYVYKQTTPSAKFTGIIAGASVLDYSNGLIKKHENTILKRENLFKKYLDVCHFHAEPVLLSYAFNDEITNIISSKKVERPEYEFTTTDNKNHELWIIDDPVIIEKLVEAFKKVDKIYIADGHHRASSSKLYFEGHQHKQSSKYFLSFLVDTKNVHIIEFNRLVKNIFPHNTDTLFKALNENFVLSEGEFNEVSPSNKREIGMYFNKKWYLLTIKKELLKNLSFKQKLNSQLVSDFILKSILNIPDLRKDKRVEFISGMDTNQNTFSKIDKLENGMLLKLFPHTMGEIIQIADSGETMPPKSTWIEPKIRSGVTIYEY